MKLELQPATDSRLIYLEMHEAAACRSSLPSERQESAS
jgi:hypothetical protein